MADEKKQGYKKSKIPIKERNERLFAQNYCRYLSKKLINKKSMTKKQKKNLTKIIAAAIFLVTGYLLPIEGLYKLAYFLIIYFFTGWEILWRAARNIIHGQIFDENFLMTIATVGAMIIGDYPEGVAVMLLYQVGELFQSYAVGKSRKSISDLMDIRPDYANIENDGIITKKDPDQVKIGDVIVVNPGEKIPLDGIIVKGTTTINAAALTGESLPKDATEGDEIMSGSVNISGLIKAKVTGEFSQSTVSKILDLVENASNKKAKTENIITRFARYYTPFVVIFAFFLAVIPPLILGGGWHIWSDWMHRALIFLVISCPCALVISVPLSFFGGVGGASKQGILVKGSNYLEILAKTKTVIFDKTGTLTKGSFVVTALHPNVISEEKLLEMAALAEAYSSHPISQSLQSAYGKVIDKTRIKDVTEIPGFGVKAKVDGKIVCAGNEKFMKNIKSQWHDCHKHGTIVHVDVEGVYAGHIVIADEIKEDARAAVARLKALGINRTIMLTGDKSAVGESVAKEIGIDIVFTQLLPADKVTVTEQVLKKKQKGSVVAFVGDGINDAPVLSRADIGIAMGAIGSDAAIEAADIVLMDDKPSKIASAIEISKKTLLIVKENIVFALVVKGVFLILGAFGIATMWEAVFADVGVSVIAIFNAMRALNIKSKS